jgi:hypothetical protein
MTSSRQTSPFVEEEAYFKTRQSLQRIEIWSWILSGPVVKTNVLAKANSNLPDWTELATRGFSDCVSAKESLPSFSSRLGVTCNSETSLLEEESLFQDT